MSCPGGSGRSGRRCGGSGRPSDDTAFRWPWQQDRPFERLFVHVEDVPGTLVLTVCGDTHHLSPADLRACLTGMAALTIEAALDPAAPTGI